MKITLNKAVQLNSAIVYMKIEKDVQRKDIQEYLQGKRFADRLVNNRIDEYLIEIGIFNMEKELTPKGVRVKESGILQTPEEGKYKIWFTQNDSYFGNRILYFRREKAKENCTLEDNTLHIDYRERHILVPTQENNSQNDFTEFTLLNLLIGKTFNQIETIEVTMVLESNKPSFCFFNGSIDKDGQTKLDMKKAVKSPEEMDEIISELLPNWDSDTQRLKIELDQIEDAKTKSSFEWHNYKCEWSIKDFLGNIDSVKLMPSDLDNAIQWRDYLLLQEVEKDYLSQKNFAKVESGIKNRDGFCQYSKNMDNPIASDFLKKTEPQSKAFWHLAAPMDLIINE